MRDKKTISECAEKLAGVKSAVTAMLELFDKYQIHATWAVTGLLFANDIKEIKQYLPKKTRLFIDYIKRT